jgi:acyl transferase domain-containing protein
MSDASNRIAALSPKQRAYLALKELQAKLDEVERARTEPIAIVGMGCRFPGGADSPEMFWKLLREGFDAVTEVPKDRYDVDEFYEADMSSTRSTNTRWGAFIDNVADFDPAFFGISTREACDIDPQQRLLLEVSWQALENAGLAPAALAGSQTGVYVALASWDYSLVHSEAPARGATGLALSIAANRISYFYDFHGPSMVTDSACSSSLVALDIASQALRNGDIDLAVVGGANFLLYPWSTVSLAQAGFMSPDGRCKTFDQTADGYVRGEGCGVVVLKRLADALSDGHQISGLICGTAVNHGGRSNGLTAPNGLAQQSAARLAIKKAGIQARQISYVEAHGTGTSLGDVVEMESLWAAIREGRGADDVCYVGSVKTNMGHLEPASGVAGLIKVLVSLQHEEIPPHLHLKQINPDLNLDDRVRIPMQPISWRRGEEPRFAGVCSFGFGGTNGYGVIQEGPARRAVSPERERPLHLLTISAKTQTALVELAKRYSAQLAAESTDSLSDVCYTANVGRTHFQHRLAARGSSRLEFRQSLDAFCAKSPAAALSYATVANSTPPRVAYVFSGWGSYHPGMGRQLFETQPLFRKIIQQCEEFVQAESQQPLLSLNAPPALFALQFALAELWKSWGIEPSAVVGHGIGEYAAACVAGAFDWKEGIKLVTERSRLANAAAAGASADATKTVFTTSSKRIAFNDSTGCDFLLEMGQPAGSFTSNTGSNGAGRIVPSLKKDEDEWETLLSSLSTLYLSGAPVSWQGFDRDYGRRRVALPTYPFERKRCWLDQSAMRTFEGPFHKVKG